MYEVFQGRRERNVLFIPTHSCRVGTRIGISHADILVSYYASKARSVFKPAMHFNVIIVSDVDFA